MNYRNFQGTDEKISLLGFGCMRFPRLLPDKADIDECLAQKMIDYAYAHGVNYFDTAYPYHEGMSETFIGKALKKYPRESFRLADKMPVWAVNEKCSAADIFEEQLKKCQVEYFDYYLCHAMGKDRIPLLAKYGIYDYLVEQKKLGRIKHLGFSFHDKPEVLEEILSQYQFDFVQIQCNYLDWELQNAKLQYEIIVNHGLQVIIMEPCRGGALADLCEESNAVFKSAEPNRSISSWAFRYVASLPEVLVVLSGMTEMEHVTDNIATFEDFSPLTESEYGIIGKALEAYRKAVTIPCTGCRYCMDCPSGVDIPAVFDAYNRSQLGKARWILEQRLDALGEKKLPEHCVKCGKCKKQCPQHIDIPVKLQEINCLYVSMKKEENCRITIDMRQK